MLLSKLCILLNNVAALPRLRSLVLKTQIIKSQNMGYWSLRDLNLSKPKVKDLFQVIKFMVCVHKKIECVHITKFEDCEIDSVQYKK